MATMAAVSVPLTRLDGEHCHQVLVKGAADGFARFTRTGLVAYMIMQSGLSCRLPKTPRTPRGAADFYFGEVRRTTRRRLVSIFADRTFLQNVATPSEKGDESAGPFSAYSGYAGSEATLGDLSPDAL